MVGFRRNLAATLKIFIGPAKVHSGALKGFPRSPALVLGPNVLNRVFSFLESKR